MGGVNSGYCNKNEQNANTGGYGHPAEQEQQLQHLQQQSAEILNRSNFGPQPEDQTLAGNNNKLGGTLPGNRQRSASVTDETTGSVRSQRLTRFDLGFMSIREGSRTKTASCENTGNSHPRIAGECGYRFASGIYNKSLQAVRSESLGNTSGPPGTSGIGDENSRRVAKNRHLRTCDSLGANAAMQSSESSVKTSESASRTSGRNNYRSENCANGDNGARPDDSTRMRRSRCEENPARQSDTRIDLTGTDSGSRMTPQQTSSGSDSPSFSKNVAKRRSSIAFLPETGGVRESSPSGLFPNRGSTATVAASPMDRVSMSLSNASDLVASLIGGGSGGFGSPSHASKKKEEDRFWVPPTVWRKQRAQSLIPGKLTSGETERDTNNIPGLQQHGRTKTESSSMQEVNLAHLKSSSADPELPSGSSNVGQTSPSPSATVAPSAATSTSAAASSSPDSQQALMLRRRRASMQDALDFTKINASLYERPMMSTQHQMFGSIQEENCGSLNFSLNYEQELSILTIHVIRAQDLVLREDGQPVDPFCRLCVLPNRRHQLFSKTHRKTQNPEFDEEFMFNVSVGDFPEFSIEIALFDSGGEAATSSLATTAVTSSPSGSHHQQGAGLGQIVLPLDEVDLTERIWLWKGISPYANKTEVDSNHGDLMFSMTYLPSAERLTVVITKARNLKPADDSKSTSSNPFVRVALISGGKRTKKKRTSTKRLTLNPVWNEALVFNLQGKERNLTTVQLEFAVYSDTLLGTNDRMGKLMLGSTISDHQTNNADQQHAADYWSLLINTKNAPARWYRLQDADL